MVGFQDSINLVKETLRANPPPQANAPPAVDHDAILRDYDKLMRDHERRMDGHRRHIRRHRSERSRSRSRSRSPKATSRRFRFKSGDKSGGGGSSGRKRKHRSREYEDQEREHGRSRHRTRTRSPEAVKKEEADVSAYAAHPLPRPKGNDYLDPAESPSASPKPGAVPRPAADKVFEGPDDAFRASLFDAIADDEGAAYWEGVYGEPIHVYSRPTMKTESGGLEEMGDEQYVEYVKRKMWEKKNPELVKERQDRARREMEEDERRKRRKRGGRDDEDSSSDYEWVGNEEKGYEWRRVRGKRAPQHDNGRASNRGFMSDVDDALARGARRKEQKKWQQAWTTYRKKWEDLKDSKDLLQDSVLARAIAWPVLSGNMQDVSKEAVDDFFRHYSLGEGETRTGLLKAERFRWHPDKIQHRFGGENVDVETLAVVTSVFQTIDELVAQERKNAAG